MCFYMDILLLSFVIFDKLLYYYQVVSRKLCKRIYYENTIVSQNKFTNTYYYNRVAKGVKNDYNQNRRIAKNIE